MPLKFRLEFWEGGRKQQPGSQETCQAPSSCFRPGCGGGSGGNRSGDKVGGVLGHFHEPIAKKFRAAPEPKSGKPIMLKKFLLTSVALAVPSLALAQNAETVVVSATRVATPALQIGSSFTLIDAAQIEAREQRSLPDLLQDVPGLAVVQTGG